MLLRMPSKRRRNQILDKLHRGCVNVCMAVTVISGSMLAYNVYYYYRYIRPERRLLAEQEQKELLNVGKSLEMLEGNVPNI